MNEDMDGKNKVKKGEINMAVMTKPSNRLPVIKADKSTQFIKASNEKKMTNAFLQQCKNTAGLFKRV